MELIILLFLAFNLVQTDSIDLVFDEEILIDGFVYVDDKVIILDTWRILSNDRYFGVTENAEPFYLIHTADMVKIKIWQENNTVRLVELTV